MSMNIYYSIREGFKGMKRARLATFLTVSSIAVSLVLLGSFVVVTYNIQEIVSQVKNRMVLEVFLHTSLSSEAGVTLRPKIEGVEGVESAVYISKEEALQRYKDEFQGDPTAGLGYNPLPASFRIVVEEERRTPERLRRIVQEIGSMQGVDEVVDKGKVFNVINS